MELKDKKPLATITSELCATLFTAVITLPLDLANNFNGILYMCAKSVYDNCRDKLQFISNIASPLALLIRGIDSALFILLLYFIIYFIFNFILERTYGKLFRSQRIHLRDSFWGELIPHLLNVSEQENQFINHTFSDNNSISYWIIKLSVIT